MIRNIIKEAKKNCNSFQTCHIKHIRLISNNAVHSLAKQTLLSSEVIVWMKDSPDIIRDIIVTAFSVNELSYLIFNKKKKHK